MTRYGEIRRSHFLPLPPQVPPLSHWHVVSEARAAREHLIAWEWSRRDSPEGQNRANAPGVLETVAGGESLMSARASWGRSVRLNIPAGAGPCAWESASVACPASLGHARWPCCTEQISAFWLSCHDASHALINSANHIRKRRAGRSASAARGLHTAGRDHTGKGAKETGLINKTCSNQGEVSPQTEPMSASTPWPSAAALRAPSRRHCRRRRAREHPQHSASAETRVNLATGALARSPEPPTDPLTSEVFSERRLWRAVDRAKPSPKSFALRVKWRSAACQVCDFKRRRNPFDGKWRGLCGSDFRSDGEFDFEGFVFDPVSGLRIQPNRARIVRFCAFYFALDYLRAAFSFLSIRRTNVR